MSVVKYSSRWFNEHESILDGKDAKRQAKGQQPISKIKEDIAKKIEYGNGAAMKSVDVILNMWSMHTKEVAPKVHIAVFQFDRCNPKRTEQKIKIRKTDKYRNDDVKLIATHIVQDWCKSNNKANTTLLLKNMCSDGNEMLYFNAEYFTLDDVKSMDGASATVETNLDNRACLYIAKIGLAGENVQLNTKEPAKPLQLNGKNKFGLNIRSIDVFSAAIMWQPGHPVDGLGNGCFGWECNGNTIIYDFAKGVKMAGYPRMGLPGNPQWTTQVKNQNLRDLLAHMRPDPIDEYAPDSRRELAKGLTIDIVAARDNRILVRADLNRPIYFTGVSNYNPADPAQNNCSFDASLVEEFLHRCAVMTNAPAKFSWQALFNGNIGSAKQLAELSERFKNSLRRLKVVQKYTDGTTNQKVTFKRRIFALMSQSADDYKFEFNGNTISVTDYYRIRYKVELKHGSTLPLVDVSEVKSKATAVPMELCFIETHRTTAAQLLACRSTNDVPADVTTKILKAAALPGEARYGQTRTYLNVSGVGRGDTSESFGVAIDPNVLKVKAVQMPPNPIEFSRGAVESVDIGKGGWRTPRGAKYREPKTIGKDWFCVLHNDCTRDWNNLIKAPFLSELATTANRMGMNWNMCDERYLIQYRNDQELADLLESRFQVVQSKVNLVLLVMPSRSASTYRTVKQWADVANGVPSQCLLLPTIRKSIRQGRVNQDTIFNLLLKINVKLGGSNWTFNALNDDLSKNLLKLRDESLYLGADVRHPQPNRCTRHFLCSYTWHSRRECPNIALAKMGELVSSGSGGSSGQGHTPNSGEKENDKQGKDGDSHSERSASPSTSPHGTRTSSQSPARKGGKGSSSRSSSSKSSTSSGSTDLGLGPDGKKEFSFAAISGTLSPDAAHTGCTVRVQSPGKEELVHITEALTERMTEYIKYNNGNKPKRIVYIRDGVADEQIARIIQEEWYCLKDACKRLAMGYNPYIVFVLAQKSHSMRMFLQGGDKGNVEMGTVVNSQSGAVSSEFNDFYMVGHRALQGTSKPVRYILLKEGFADEKTNAQVPAEYVTTEVALMRELYALHLMNARAQKGCRLPAPVTHAHLAAERATIHAHDKMDNAQASSQVKVHENTKTRMYWM